MKVMTLDSGFVLGFKSTKEIRGHAEALLKFADWSEQNDSKSPHLFAVAPKSKSDEVREMLVAIKIGGWLSELKTEE